MPRKIISYKGCKIEMEWEGRFLASRRRGRDGSKSAAIRCNGTPVGQVLAVPSNGTQNHVTVTVFPPEDPDPRKRQQRTFQWNGDSWHEEAMKHAVEMLDRPIEQK